MGLEEETGLFLGTGGPLAAKMPGYQPRPAQAALAAAAARAIGAPRVTLVAEAATGTGKSMAYLAAALLSGKKTLVATATKNLQDQLLNQEIPLLLEAAGRPVTAALLKGRGNYLCLYRLSNAVGSAWGHSKEDALTLANIQRWASHTQVGDIAEVPDVAEHDPVWHQVTATADNCLGQDCPVYGQCHVLKARKTALEADILVVNHHLLCADWSIKDGGFGKLLPDVEVVVIDEAHQLVDIATDFLGIRVGARQLHDLAADTLVEYFKDATDMPALREACEALQQAVAALRMAFGLELRRGDWQEMVADPERCDGLAAVKRQLQRLGEQLALAAIKTKPLAHCHQRAQALEQHLESVLVADDDQSVRWFEVHKKTFTLNKTPLDIAGQFSALMRQYNAAWIFTSATLSVAHRFDHFIASLGLGAVETARWDSPFDYARQALFYHPRGLPHPGDADFIPRLTEFVLPVLHASQGRAFFLFTSHKALQQASALLEHQLPYPLLVQGSRPKAKLLDEFKASGNAVLLGTASFWEGVDVRGDALSCVIIDKLPFPSPADPVVKARLAALERQGKNPFFTDQLPRAVIALKQGVGRLIRDTHDRGVLMIGDPRLLKRAYGQQFLDSLPPMRRTRELAEVQAFFRGEEGR